MAGSRRINRSRVGRAARIGGVAAGYAARTLGARAAGVGRSEERAQAAIGRQHVETARRMVKVLGGMRGAAMKIGQTLSAVDVGLVPEEFREEFQQTLAELQQTGRAAPFRSMRRVIESDLGERLGAVFSEFDEEPVAAASIGQVYRATLRDGRDVAVKVQYPGIKDAVRADLQNLGMMLKLLSVIAPGIDTREIAAELRERITEELDYELEAQNHRALARAYRGHPFIAVPDVVGDLCRERVIVSEYVEGRRFDQLGRLDDSERSRLGEIIVRFYVNGPYRHRLLNGDPHPGNALFPHDGTVAFLDFGFFKRLTDEEVRQQIGSARAAFDEDAQGLLEVIASSGALSPDPELAEPLLESYLGILGWLMVDEPLTVTPDRTGAMMAQYTAMRADRFAKLTVPAHHLVLLRAVMLLIGILGQLRATNNWLDIAREWLLDEPPVTELGRLEAEYLADRHGERA
jgi:predicted unusual protein kinase regulating ubiquinone biosynthesis (AarF/ABC1/UbiB family)